MGDSLDSKTQVMTPFHQTLSHDSDSPILRLLKLLEDKMGFTSEIEYIASFRGVVDMASCIVFHGRAEEIPSVK